MITGAVLVAGLVVFLVGAAGWRRAYERPFAEAAPLIVADRRRRVWIHCWILAAMFVTPAGLAGFAALPEVGPVGAMGALVYAIGATCWIVSVAFRLAVVPWAAERTVADGSPPLGFPELNAWAGVLYVVHMTASYASFVILGIAVLRSDGLPDWLGWLGIGLGAVFLAGFVGTRFAGPFNPPFMAHTFTAVLGVVLLTSA